MPLPCCLAYHWAHSELPLSEWTNNLGWWSKCPVKRASGYFQSGATGSRILVDAAACVSQLNSGCTEGPWVLPRIGHTCHEHQVYLGFFFLLWLFSFVQWSITVSQFFSFSRIKMEWAKFAWLITFSFDYNYWSRPAGVTREGRGRASNLRSGTESVGSSPLAHLFMVHLPQFTHSFSRPTPLFWLYLHKPP